MGFIVLLLIAGLFMYLLWRVFFKTVMWVLQPLAEHMEGKEEEKFEIADDSSPINVKITVTSIDEPLEIPKPILQRAQGKPQKLPGTNLWIYGNSILSSDAARKKAEEILRDEKKLSDLLDEDEEKL